METVYIETTIVSYLVARPSRDLVLTAHQQLTRDWWQNERGNYQCMISTEVLREAAQGEAEMIRLRLEALEGVEIIRATPEIDAAGRGLFEYGSPAAIHAF